MIDVPPLILVESIVEQTEEWPIKESHLGREYIESKDVNLNLNAEGRLSFVQTTSLSSLHILPPIAPELVTAFWPTDYVPTGDIILCLASLTTFFSIFLWGGTFNTPWHKF